MQTVIVSMRGHVAGLLQEEAISKLASNIPTILKIALQQRRISEGAAYCRDGRS